MSKNKYINDFNEVIIGIVKYITQFYGDMNTIKIQYVLEETIKKTPEELIFLFMCKIYNNDEYRKNILAQNDLFFIGEDYSDLVKNDENKVAQIFQFKSLWKTIDDNTKTLIKKSMVALVNISREYILNCL
jgi:hypothetical protein